MQGCSYNIRIMMVRSIANIYNQGAIYIYRGIKWRGKYELRGST